MRLYHMLSKIKKTTKKKKIQKKNVVPNFQTKKIITLSHHKFSKVSITCQLSKIQG